MPLGALPATDSPGRTVNGDPGPSAAKVPGTPRRIINIHLIVTPEYLRRMTTQHPDVVVYAVRLDRGLSQPDVLATVPGTRWDEERGLTDHQYIVPGGGGFGEIMNNAYV